MSLSAGGAQSRAGGGFPKTGYWPRAFHAGRPIAESRPLSATGRRRFNPKEKTKLSALSAEFNT